MALARLYILYTHTHPFHFPTKRKAREAFPPPHTSSRLLQEEEEEEKFSSLFPSTKNYQINSSHYPRFKKAKVKVSRFCMESYLVK